MKAGEKGLGDRRDRDRESLWKFFPFPGAGPVTRVSPISVRFIVPGWLVTQLTDTPRELCRGVSRLSTLFRDRIYIYPFSNESKFPRNGQNLNELNSLLARLLPSSLIDPNDARVSSSDRPYETVSSGIRIRLIAFQEYARGYATVCYPTRTRARTHTHERAYT